MMYTVALVVFLTVAAHGVAQAHDEDPTNQPPGGAAGSSSELKLDRKTVTVKVTEVAWRTLSWIVTFEEKSGTLHRCHMRSDDPFLKETGLDVATKRQGEEKGNDFGRSWYEIVISSENKGYSRILSWRPIRNDAEPAHAGDGSTRAR